MTLSSDFLLKIIDVIETTAVVFTAAVGFYRYKKITVSARTLIWVVIFTCLFDYIGDYLRDTLSSLPAFILSLYVSLAINILLVAVFFNYCIPQFRKIKLGIYFVLAIVLFGAINVLFSTTAWGFSGTLTTDTLLAARKHYMNFLTFFTLLSIAAGLAALFILFQKKAWLEIRRNLNFWLLVVNLFMDGCVFINSALVPLVTAKYLTTHVYLLNLITSIFDLIPNDLGILTFGILFLVFTRKGKQVVKAV